MEIINLRHEEIIMNRRTNAYAYINFVSSKRILFSVKAAQAFGLTEGLYAHFVNDEKLWLFFVNNNTDGFPLKQRKYKNNIEIFNTGLVSLFTKTTGIEVPCKFPLKLTDAKTNGCQLIEIDLKKRL